ncbi:MAG: O-antigen ligase family protein [Acidobacteria bacterium]|nr:O-antigen ligase family protein [Acidobacteriota bacterium]
MIIEKIERPSDLALPTGCSAPPSLSLFHSLLPLLLFAIALGMLLAVFATLSLMWVWVVCVGLCGVFGILLWRSANWPLTPILQVALPASLFFKLEGHLFTDLKYNESPPGLNISLMLIVSLMLLGAHISRRWRGKPRDLVLPLGYSLASLTLLLWCILSILDSSEPLFGFYAVWGQATILLMCFVAANEFGSRAALRTAVIVLAVVAGVNSLVALLQSSTGMFADWTFLGAAREENRQTISEGDILRASGFLGTSNGLAWYLATFLPVPLSMLVLKVEDFRGWKRWLLAASSGLGVIALILTYARGSWIALGVALLALIALLYRTLTIAERRRFTLRVAALALLTVLISLPFAGTIYIRLTEDDRGSAYSRVPLIQVAQAMIADNLWLGVGLSNYEAEMRRYDTTSELISDGFDWPVHNIFLHMTAEAGIPATLSFLALIIIALRRGWRALSSRDPFLRALAAGLIAGIIAYMLSGLKEPSSFGSPKLRLCFFFCGLLLALDRARSRNDERTLTGEKAISH